MAIRNYCENSARFIFSDHEPDPYANKILTALKDGPKSMTDLHNLFQRKLKADVLKMVLKDFVVRGKIKTERIKTKGKDGVSFFLVTLS